MATDEVRSALEQLKDLAPRVLQEFDEDMLPALGVLEHALAPASEVGDEAKFDRFEREYLAAMRFDISVQDYTGETAKAVVLRWFATERAAALERAARGERDRIRVLLDKMTKEGIGPFSAGYNEAILDVFRALLPTSAKGD